MPELAYLNGKFMSIEEATIPIEDRGLQFGDSLYEVIRLYNNYPFQLDAHISRMKRGAQEIELDIEAAGNLVQLVYELAKRSCLDSALMYIQVTRGVAPRNHVIPKNIQPNVIATVKNIQPHSENLFERGCIAFTTPDLRWTRRDIKATTLLPNILAANWAVRNGAYDAIFYEKDGTVTEGAKSNLFAVVDDVLVTHPLDNSVLPGVSRSVVLDCAENIGIQYNEEYFSIHTLYKANEIFFTDTLSEIMPIIEIDGQVIGNYTPGPITNKLRAAFKDIVQKETGENRT